MARSLYGQVECRVRDEYFAGPDGHPWEVAHNPGFPIGEDGRITIS